MKISEDEIQDIREQVLASIDLGYCVGLVKAIDPKTEIKDKEQFLCWYLQCGSHRLFSPNDFFDEIFYRTCYTDVSDVIASGEIGSGLLHYIRHGLQEGRSPNREIHENCQKGEVCYEPISSIDALDSKVRHSKWMVQFGLNFRKSCLTTFYNTTACRLLNSEIHVSFRNLIAEHFDADHYKNQSKEFVKFSNQEALLHYISIGCKEGLSPNSKFDEKFYLAFYSDVRLAVERGDFVSGFEHYLVAGLNEGRLGRYSFEKSLELKYPGLTEPQGLGRVADIQAKLNFPSYAVTDGGRRINFVLPDLNPDIFFGGYETLINLMRFYVKSGERVRVIKTESGDSSLEYLVGPAKFDCPLQRPLTAGTP